MYQAYMYSQVIMQISSETTFEQEWYCTIWIHRRGDAEW